MGFSVDVILRSRRASTPHRWRGKLRPVASSSVVDPRRIVLAYAQGDPAVPLAQGEAMARALPSARLIVLQPGPARFVHSGVSVAALQRTVAAAEAFLANVTSSWPPSSHLS